MRTRLIEQMKSEIEKSLRDYLREEGIELSVAANDNMATRPSVVLESVQDTPLQHDALLSEIRVILDVLGKASQCEALIAGIYEALHPHFVTHRELTVILMSLHVESTHCVRPRRIKKCAIVRYIVEETPAACENILEKAAGSESEYC